MRTVAGLLNILLRLALVFAVATVVNLDFPGNVVAYVVGALLVLAGIGILVVGEEVNRGAAWYYPQTTEAARDIEGWVAFWRGVAVER